MSRSRLALVPLLAMLLALGACGDTGSGIAGPTIGQGTAAIPATSAPGDLASLVPAEADLLLYVPSIDDLQAKVRRVVGAVDPGAAEEVDVDEILGQIAGPVLDLLDRTQPIAVVGIFKPGEKKPSPVMLLPVQDVAAAKKRFTDGKLAEPMTKGAYLAFTPMKDTPVGDGKTVPAIAENFPAGDLALRVNLARLRETFKDDIAGSLAEMDETVARASEQMPFDPSGIMGTMKQTLEDLLESAESLDLTVSVDATTVDLAVLFQAKAGSKMDGVEGPSGDLAAMAKALPPSAVSMLLSMDFGEMTAWLEKVMDIALEMYPEDARASFKSQWDKAKGLYDHLGNEHAMAFDLSEKGMTVVSVSAAKDADAYLKGAAALMDDQMVGTLAKMGIEYAKPEPSKVAGFDVLTYRMAMDMKKLMEFTGQADKMPPEALDAMDQMMTRMFGPDGAVFHMANVKGKVVMMMGGGQPLLESTLKAVGSGGTANDALAAALGKMGGKATFLMHMDLRAFLGGILGLMKEVAPEKAKDEIPTLEDGAPVPITVAGTAQGRSYVGRLSLDVKALADMIKPLFK